MRNLEKLTLFFQAENQKDWETYQSFLHHGITWKLHGQRVSVIYGIDDYLLNIQQVYHHSNINFPASINENQIITILKNDFGQLSCDIFGFENGLIIREYKYLL